MWLAKEETFPIPLKYIDVTRTTKHNLGCIAGTLSFDDDWNVDGDRELSDALQDLHGSPFKMKDLVTDIHGPAGG